MAVASALPRGRAFPPWARLVNAVGLVGAAIGSGAEEGRGMKRRGARVGWVSPLAPSARCTNGIGPSFNFSPAALIGQMVMFWLEVFYGVCGVCSS